MDAGPSASRFVRLIHLIEDFLLAAVLLTLVLFSFFQLLLKNLVTGFNLAGRHYTILPLKWLLDNIGPGFNWGDAFLRQLVLWLAVLGAVMATREDRHINVEIASKFLPKKWGIGVRVFTDAFTTVVCALISYAGFNLVRSEIGSDSMAFANVPAWIMELIIPIGFGIIALRFARYFVIHTLQAFGILPMPPDGQASPPEGAA